MALQTGVLVNGQWTTRPMDLYAILAGNKGDPGKKMVSERHPAPSMGILTKTISYSPVLKWIIPARIRAADKNDVIFIGEHFVQIKELLPDGHLQDVVTKSDFGGATIRSARVFGNARQPADPVDVQQGADVKRKDASIEKDRLDDDESASRIPPQILILTLDTNRLVFLFAFNDRRGRVKFLSSHLALPSQRSFLQRHGKHLAVDPKSRAFAVAACQESFSLYALKPRSQLRDEMESGDDLSSVRLKPVREERQLSVDGTILKMEFLYPSPDDEDHVILLLVVSNDQTTRLLCFEWDYTTSLRTVKQLGTNGQPVGKRETLPILLIPLTIASAFILVCEHVVTVYRDILTGTATPRPIGQNKEPARDKGGSSRKPPLWTYWARPVRTADYSSRHDDLFLCREDGIVKALDICEDSAVMLNAQVKAGALGCNIDTAFASLDLGLNHPDLLIAGGDMSVGGIFEFQSRSSPKFIEAVPNWAPTIDCALVPSEGSSRHQSTLVNEAPGRSNRLFTCAGRDRFGACAEIRYGIEGRMGWTLSSEEFPSIVDMWTLADPSKDGFSLLLSFPLYSSLIHLSADGSILPDESDHTEGGLDLRSKTLAVTITAQGCCIQVTEGSIRVKRSLRADMSHPSILRECPPGEKIVAAAVDSQLSLVVTVLRRGNGEVDLCATCVSLIDGKISINEIEQPIRLTSEPTCLAVLRIGKTPFVFVGTIAATLQIFRLDAHSGPVPILEHTMNGAGDVPSVCHSVSCISSNDNQLLLCGQRDGQMHIFSVATHDEPVTVTLLHSSTQVMGTTSVKIFLDNIDSAIAYVTCDPDFCRIGYDELQHRRFSVSNVWLTDADDVSPYILKRLRIRLILAKPSYRQPPILASSQVPPSFQLTDSNYSGLVVLILGAKLVVAALDRTVKVVSRRIPVMGTPRRLMFSRHLNMLVTVITTSESKPPRQRSSPGIQPRPRVLLRDCIEFIDPDQPTIKIEGDEPQDLRLPKRIAPVGKVGERVLGIIDWNPSEGDRTYHFLVICTSIKQPGELQDTGRIAFFNVRRNEQGGLDVAEKRQLSCARPVYSVASLGLSSIVYCSGAELTIKFLDLTDKKWQTVCMYRLRSPGNQITVNGTFIYVTTASDSLEILKFEHDTLTPQFSDSVARDGLHHLILPNLELTLASDKACNVAGLWQPATPFAATPATLFEAELPGSMIRLRLGSIRPPWRSLSTLPGLLQDGIIGVSVDGALHQFTLLTAAAWRLLRFIQNLCARNPSVCPITYHQSPLDHIEPNETNPRSFHIDGNMLCRLLALESSELQFMLDQMSSSTDAEEVRARRERFEELVGGVLQDVHDPVEAAMNYMRCLLQPLL
ncbi:MAG: hypothetical protein M1836_005186 [Candelina mexicana]|nr:MAG: hypothetical protein M1836_005186 [Candelina mexicana]